MPKVLLNSTAVQPGLKEQLHGLHTFDRAYVEYKKANIVKPEVEKIEKVA